MVSETQRPALGITGSGRSSRRIVLGALCMIGATFVAHALANQYVIRATEARTSRLERNSIRGVEQLARLSHDLDQERVLVDDHIFETSQKKLSEIERQLSEVAAALRRAEAEYARNAKLPSERAGWEAVRASIQRFQATLSASLELSRMNRTLDARRKIVEIRNDYAALERRLAALIEANRANALESVQRIERIERAGDAVIWAIRWCALLGGLLLAGWTFKRVSYYENRLREHAELLETKNRDLDLFAGRVAHDLKSALAPIALSATVLRQACSDSSRVVEIAERTERCCRRMAGIVDALLAFSRAAYQVQPDEVSALNDVLGNVVDEVTPLAKRVSGAIELDTIADADTLVRCDARLLHVVLANILGNALKYLDGCETRRVRVSSGREDTVYRIEVQDTGPGIPEHAIAKVFEPFYRVAGTRVQGAGIGLATVRRIVDARGGRVIVESVEGCGSRFKVWLPLARQ